MYPWNDIWNSESFARLNIALAAQMSEFEEVKHQFDKIYYQYLPVIEKINAINDELSSHLGNLEITMSPLKDLISKFPDPALYENPAYYALTQHINKMDFSNPDQSGLFNSIALELNNALIEFRGNQKPSVIANLIQFFQEKIQTLSPSHINYKGILQNLHAVISLLLTLYTIFQSGESTKQTNQKFDEILKFEREIITEIEQLKSPKRPQNLYISLTKVNVRANPSRKSSRICYLYPNHEVDLIKKKNNWYYISFFDYVNSEPKCGYVYYIYLKKKTDY